MPTPSEFVVDPFEDLQGKLRWSEGESILGKRPFLVARSDGRSHEFCGPTVDELYEEVTARSFVDDTSIFDDVDDLNTLDCRPRR